MHASFNFYYLFELNTYEKGAQVKKLKLPNKKRKEERWGVTDN